MLKRLLVPLGDSEYSLKAMEYAIHLAGTQDIHITGLALINWMEKVSPIPSYVQEQVDQALEKVESLITDRKFPKERYDIKKATGNPFRQIIREAVFSDVIVIGQKCHFPPKIQEDDSLKQLMYFSSRPILFTPLKFQPVKQVVMGIDGTASFSRLFHMYQHLNPFPNGKLFLVHTQEEMEMYNLQEFLPRVEKTFRERGFQVERLTVNTSFQEGLVRVASQANADLISFGVPQEHHQGRIQFDPTLAKKIAEESQLPLFTFR